MRTGWPSGLLQDDSRELSRWFASRIDARRCVRVRVMEIEMDEKFTCPACGSDKVAVTEETKYMVNTLEHYCYSFKAHDEDAKVNCLYCEWEGKRKDLVCGARP